MESPLKRRRLFAPENLEVELNKRRNRNYVKLKSRFESIFEKYSKDFTDIGDEIDFEKDEIVVDNGHLLNMAHEVDPGDEIECSDDAADMSSLGQTGDGGLSAVIPDTQNVDSLDDDPLGVLDRVSHATISTFSQESEGLSILGRNGNSSVTRIPMASEGPHVKLSSMVHQAPITSQRSDVSWRLTDDSDVEEAWRVPLLPKDCAERPCLPSPSPTDQDHTDSSRSASPPGVSLWTPESKRKHRSAFTEDEDELLRYCRTCTDLTWAATCALLPDRHCGTLQRRWRFLNQDMQTVAQADDNNKWTSKESQLLERLKTSSHMSGIEIQRELPRHSRGAIAYHWHLMCQATTKSADRPVALSPNASAFPAINHLRHHTEDSAIATADIPLLWGEASSDQWGPRLDDTRAGEGRFPPGTVVADSQGGEGTQHALEQPYGLRASPQEPIALPKARVEDDKKARSKARSTRCGRARGTTISRLGKRKRVPDKGSDASSANTGASAHEIGNYEVIVISSSPEPEKVTNKSAAWQLEYESFAHSTGRKPSYTDRTTNGFNVPARMETAKSIHRPDWIDTASKAHPRHTASFTTGSGAEQRSSRLQQSIALGAAHAETSTTPSKSFKVVEDLYLSFAKSQTDEAASQRLERQEQRVDVGRTEDALPRLESRWGPAIFKHLQEPPSPTRQTRGVPLCRQVQNPAIQREDWERIRARVQSEEAGPDQEKGSNQVTSETPTISSSQVETRPSAPIPEETLALESQTLANRLMVDVLRFDDLPIAHGPRGGSVNSTTEAAKISIAASHDSILSEESIQSSVAMSSTVDGPELGVRRIDQSLAEAEFGQEPSDKTSLPATPGASLGTRPQTNEPYPGPAQKPATPSCRRLWYVQIPGPSFVEPRSLCAPSSQEKNEDGHGSNPVFSQGSNSEMQEHRPDIAAVPDVKKGQEPGEPQDNQQCHSLQDLFHSPSQIMQDTEIMLPTVKELGDPSTASGHLEVLSEFLSEDPSMTNKSNLPGDRPPLEDSLPSHEQTLTEEDHDLEERSAPSGHAELASEPILEVYPSIVEANLPGHSPPIEDASSAGEQASTKEDDQDDLQLPSKPAMTPIPTRPKHRTSNGGAHRLALRPKIDEMDMSDDELSTPVKMIRDRLEMTPVASLKSAGRRLTSVF
ncbi:MAG: hypothetical protein Q9177_005236 [Variospora cf. flavescens]